MRLAIVGAGRMGSWFARYFNGRGVELGIYDRSREKAYRLASTLNSKVVGGMGEAVKWADVILLATPISVTPKLVLEAGELGFEGTLIEISSVKGKVHGYLARLKGTTLSLHPLFGPGLEEYSRAKCLLIPVKDVEEELEAARRLFPEFKFEVLGVEEHDRSVALTISTVYALNLAYISLLLEDENAAKVEGTTGRVQRMLALAVLNDSPGLIAELVRENPYTPVCLLYTSPSPRDRG